MIQEGQHDKVEARTASTPVGHATASAVLGLAKAARSFSLYDPANNVVRNLIQDYRDKIEKALGQHGPMALDVHPFELLRGSEVVYIEKDRERSLSFRLFRDGVRRLTFLPSVSWEELLRLLEVFSIRFTGVRQQEDDLVTLLRKANFAGIEVVAVEGFVPDEEQPEEAQAESAVESATPRVEPPADWDLPLPALGRPVLVPRREVPAELLARLAAEEAPDATGAQAVRAVRALLHTVSAPEDREDAVAFAVEVRDFLLVDTDGPHLLDLARVVADGLPPGDCATALATLLDDRAMSAVLTSASVDGAALGALLAKAPPETLQQVLRVAADAPDGPALTAIRRLLAVALGADTLERRLSASPPEEARVLLGALAEADRPRALALAASACHTRGSPLTCAALALLGENPGPEVVPTLREHLADPDPLVRLEAARGLGRAGARGVPLLQGHADRHHATFTEAEAQEVGRALATASAAAAVKAVQGWLAASGKNLLGRLSMPTGLQWVAVGALQQATSREADALLQQLGHSGAAEVKQRCAELLAARSGGTARG